MTDLSSHNHVTADAARTNADDLKRTEDPMRLLIWHVDDFVAEPTQRGRSRVADAEPPTVRVADALVVFAQSERSDEPEPDAVAERAAEAIVSVAAQLKVTTVVLHSFAHLFGELSDPLVARQVLAATQMQLEQRGLVVQQTAFGWFNRLELRAKGHPFSRQARSV
ncbi:MAG TPA: threonyl-tRNA synthetase editing domain-containing protein [Ktedonobacterales bacterium]|nr:threonyl-tRNA synthetase editing domain-containing protein [Ktedonobacterales bacterium]